MSVPEGRRLATTVRLPADLHNKLASVARDADVNINELIVAWLAHSVRLGWKVGRQPGVYVREPE